MEKPAVGATFLNKAVQTSNTPAALNKVGARDATVTLSITGEKTSASAGLVHQAGDISSVLSSDEAYEKTFANAKLLYSSVNPGGIVTSQQEEQETTTKSISPQKLAANRRNAKRSTGPRTERGKKTSKFNAVVTGLFARHVVIPICDGWEGEEEFAKLLAALQQEFQPERLLEEFWVGQMAECMWKLRRVTRVEKASVRRMSDWEGKPPSSLAIDEPYIKERAILECADWEIRTTGALSAATYAAVLPILEPEKRDMAQAEKNQGSSEPAEPVIDDQLLASIKWKIQVACAGTIQWLNTITTMEEDHFAEHALPPEATTNKILRYEKAAQKKFDWALQQLLASQRRKNSQTPA